MKWNVHQGDQKVLYTGEVTLSLSLSLAFSLGQFKMGSENTSILSQMK